MNLGVGAGGNREPEAPVPRPGSAAWAWQGGRLLGCHPRGGKALALESVLLLLLQALAALQMTLPN